MKNGIGIFLVLMLVCSGLLVGQTDKKNLQQRKITFGMIGKKSTNPVFIAAYSGARVAAKELGAKYKLDIVIDWKSPEKENAQEQASALEGFARSGVNGVAISCVDANYLTSTINQVTEKGIPVMCYDSDAPKSKRFVYHGADDIEFGKMLLRELASELNDKGSIAVLAGNKNALNLQRRLQGIKEELKKHPNIVLVPDNVCYNIELPDLAGSTVEREQKKRPTIKGWIFIGSTILQAKNNLKWNAGEVKVVAGNAIPAELDYVQSGYVQGLVGVNCFQMGYKSVELLLDKVLHNHAPADQQLYAPLTPVSKKNVEEWSLNWKKWLLKEAMNR